MSGKLGNWAGWQLDVRPVGVALLPLAVCVGSGGVGQGHLACRTACAPVTQPPPCLRMCACRYVGVVDLKTNKGSVELRRYPKARQQGLLCCWCAVCPALLTYS